MLNLTEIRKKARKGKKGPAATPDDIPVSASEAVDAPVHTAVPETSTPTASDAPSAEASSPRKQPAPSAGQKAAASERSAERQPKEQSASPSDDAARIKSSYVRGDVAQDPLEALFSLNGQVDFATEESYFAGLVGEDDQVDETQRQLLSFSLGDEEYMVDIRRVREIIKMRDITDIPRAPYFILGIISLRGSIIPVYDLKKRLKLGAIEGSPDNRIVVCQEGDKSVGLLVERINEVVKLYGRDIEVTPAMLSGLDRDLVEGVGRHEGRMMILLDLANVLDAELF